MTHSFAPDVSPPQRRWKAFTTVLAEAGHQISVVAPGMNPQGRPAEEVAETEAPTNNVRLFNYRTWPRPRRLLSKAASSLLQALVSIPVGLRAGRQDIVIATIPALSTLLSGYLVSRLMGARFVVDLRDSWPNLFRDSKILRSERLEPWATKSMLAVLRRADLVVAVTGGLARVAGAQGMQRVATVPNGVDLAAYPQPLARGASRPTDRRLRVLYLGNLGLSQGLETLVRAAAQLRETVEVRLVGEGHARERLRQMAEELDAPVTFIDPVRGAKVLDMYRWADTTLVSLRADWPSFEHTIPSKLYELLALDVHVTGLVSGEAAQIIRQAEAGDVVSQSVDSLVEHLRLLQRDDASLRRPGLGPKWIAGHADLVALGQDYLQHLQDLPQPVRRRAPKPARKP
ncbi:glycosyltransferase family 4 protein [Glutamicibacter protophormiae]|uniref:glycosyltransferase family 4 protein n=1 Tax=Glutamicibacter protophormiae TaxID=37930 RepID=UPI00195DBE5C|nr:glycosyltransferase family 4 protein [Glutamicibacter protophormiae]QRQ79976.1 glycosyltransferase family 4 protein [Glutamicibacter protophormiae]